MLGVVGDSAAGKTTLTDGIVNIFGQHRVTAICIDDYHRYDREARKVHAITPLHPDCNYLEIMEQHLHHLAVGEPILKPVYNHDHGTLDAPELIDPADFVVIEGLLAFHSKALRSTFDVKVYLDPPEETRRNWKIKRDTSKRNYTTEAVLADLDRREPDSQAFIRPQRAEADIVVQFRPPPPGSPESTGYNVHLVLRPTLQHPYLADISSETRTAGYEPIRFSLDRDAGKPVDVLEIDGSVPPEVSAAAEEIIWERMHPQAKEALNRDAIGVFNDGNEQRRSESLALTQLLIVFQLIGAQTS